MIYPGHYDMPPIMKNYPWDFSFNITLDDVVMQLQGYNIKFRILLSLESEQGDALIELTREPQDGIVVDDEDEGQWVTMSMPRSKTKDLPLGQHCYTIELTQPNGVLMVIMCGRIRVMPCDGAGGE